MLLRQKRFTYLPGEDDQEWLIPLSIRLFFPDGHVETISEDTDIFEAAQLFLTKHFRRFPVLRDGKLVGQISQKDIMKAVLSLKSNTW